MAGADSLELPWPGQENAAINFHLAGVVTNGLTTELIDVLFVPFNARVKYVRRTLTSTGSSGGGDVMLRTIDDDKQLIADAATSDTDLVAIEQTLHSDIVGYTIQRGDKIKLDVDTQGANETGFHAFDIGLVPIYGSKVAT